MKRVVDQATASALLRYEPETGRLFWRMRDVSWFPTTPRRSAAHSAARWNSQYADKEAFATTDAEGYKVGCIFGRRYYAHRVIWLMERGHWPVGIDHEVGVRDDNRLSEMREADQPENVKNRRISKNNSSGAVGVQWDKKNQKWRAIIGVGDRMIHLGRFVDKDAAIAARLAASTHYGFHENHGRTAA